MPEGQDNELIVCLCEDNWQLHELVNSLEAWLIENHSKLQPSAFMAIASFSVEENHSADAVAFSPTMLRTMGDLGMWLCLAKYPNADES
jgi:hypothetical protein